MPIRVLHYSQSMNLGGAESRVMDLFRAIDRSKFDFDFVITDEGEQHFEKEIKLLGGEIHRIPGPRNIFSHLRTLNSLLRHNRYDALHSHAEHHSGLISFIAWVNRVPVRLGHARASGVMPPNSMLRRIHRITGKWLLNVFATHRIAVSNEAARFIFGKTSISTYLPNAINVDHYLKPRSGEVLRAEFNIPQDGIVLGQIGRLVSIKNQKFSILLLKTLLKRNPNFFLVLVGDGIDREELGALAAQEDVHDRVLFAGLQNDVADWLATFNVLLMPSHYEGLGNAVLEAQAMGVPVIASQGVPFEADMGLSLVEFLSLDDSSEVWAKAVDESLRLPKPSKAEILKAFGEQGYTLKAVLEVLERLYTDQDGLLA